MQQSGTDEHCFYLLSAVGEKRGGTGALLIQNVLYIYQEEDCGSMAGKPGNFVVPLVPK